MSNQAIRQKHISKHYHVYAAGLSHMWAKYSSCWLQQQTNCLFYSFISALWTWRELKIVQKQLLGQELPIQIQSETEQEKGMKIARNAQNATNWEVFTSQLAQH